MISKTLKKIYLKLRGKLCSIIISNTTITEIVNGIRSWPTPEKLTDKLFNKLIVIKQKYR